MTTIHEIREKYKGKQPSPTLLLLNLCECDIDITAGFARRPLKDILITERRGGDLYKSASKLQGALTELMHCLREEIAKEEKKMDDDAVKALNKEDNT